MQPAVPLAKEELGAELDAMLTAVDLGAHGVDMPPEVVRRLEQRHVVLGFEEPRARHARPSCTDYRDTHQRTSDADLP